MIDDLESTVFVEKVNDKETELSAEHRNLRARFNSSWSYADLFSA